MTAQELIELLYQKGAALSVKDNQLSIEASDDVLDDGLLSLIKNHKAAIIDFLEELESETTIAIVKHQYPSSYDSVASLAQQRILFMEELAGNNSYYNIPVAYKITGFLNRVALFQSLSRLVARHDILRTIYPLKDNIYIQRIQEPVELSIGDVSITNEFDKNATLQALLQKEAHYIFDLSREWPIRVRLIEVDKYEHVLSINIHHIAADGWSARNIVDEISMGYQLYLNSADNLELGDSERDYQYADYVCWQDEWKKTACYQEAKKYWSSVLNGVPELHSLPTDFIRPTIQTVIGNVYTQVITTAQMAAITASARTYNTTPFVIFQAVFAAFLARYSGESDIVFGTAAVNRKPVEFINTVGLFVNTLVLRHQISENISFDELIRLARKVSSEAFHFQQLPFDAVVDELQPVRSLSYSPLVQIMLVMQENISSRMRLDGAEVVQLKQQQNVSKFDLALHVYNDKNAMHINWEYSSSLFTHRTIQAMSTHFGYLLDACLSMPDKEINSIPLVNEKLNIAINTDNFPQPVCIHKLFESQVALFSERVAVSGGKHSITYKELNTQTNHIASHLYAACNGNVGRIGLCMDKSSELLVGLLAIMKVGAVYVPLDPHYPKERLEWMVSDSKINILLTSHNTKLPVGFEGSAQILFIETLFNTEVVSQYIAAADVNTPAYIIYTSGSTGKPKGVLVSHKSLFYSLHANRSLMNVDQYDVMPTIGSQAFGVSLLEILLPLTSGGEVCLIKKEQITDIDQLIKVTNEVTVLHAVPSLMRQWLDVVIAREDFEIYPRLRLLLVGGEAVPAGLLEKIKRWRPNVRLLELYGMTESAVVCSSYAASEESHTHYCIGKPHPNTYFYVLNSHGQQQPLGVPGELHIGGLSLADGYINQEKITSEKFIDNPYLRGEKLYKTGDRVRLLDGGHYEFLGRVDHQVSLRGVRIELGEIETLAAAVEGVKQAVAYIANLGDDEKTLVLYYTSDFDGDEQKVVAQRIRMYLAQYLPDHMRPSIIQYLDLFPLNPNGKVDRNNLPSPGLGSSIVEPETELERQLLSLWKSALQCESISVTANFFEMGGHSLMAAKLATQIRASFSIALPLTVLFESPNIRSCALYIENALKQKYAHNLIRDKNAHDMLDEEELIL